MLQYDDNPILTGEELRTRLLNQPLSNFKRLDAKVTSHLHIHTLRFVLPKALIIDLPAMGKIILGRQSNNSHPIDVNLDLVGGAEAGISRIHAIVQVAGDAIYILDLQSSNGVYLNGQELYPMRNYKLHSGDELRLGSVQIGVRFIDK